MTKIRVLVVDDSLTVRRRICEVLNADPELEVVGEAADGKRGIELCHELRPDVMTLDMLLPIMTGLSVTEHVMAHCPTPILIVSSSTNRGNLFKTYDALAAGAVDVLEKHPGDGPDGDWERQLVSTVKLVSRIKVITHVRGRLAGMVRPSPAVALPPEKSEPNTHARFQMVALGTSTGGPSALVQVLRAIPPRPQASIFVVLHIDAMFSAALAEWLREQTPHLQVGYAKDLEPLSQTTGRVVMAPPGMHTVVDKGVVRLTMAPERHSCRPSIDTLFESIAVCCGSTTLACLLTGMGRDGAKGLLDIREAGGHTIAQDEATSVVYGMPREAALLGAASRILPLSEIGPTIAAHLRQPQVTS